MHEIYHTRRKLFFTAFAVLFLMGAFYGQNIDSRSSKFKNSEVISRTMMKCIGVALLEIPILACGTFIFFKRVNCFRKDINDGYKYPVVYTIVAKQYFPLTNQYFVSFDDPDYLHHEVSESNYQLLNVDDQFPVYMTRYSRYAFNSRGSFTIL